MAQLFVVLILVLAVVTVVGHGIWVLIARLFGSGSAPTPTLPDVGARRACPRCLTPLELDVETCPVCDWPKPWSASTRPEAALAALRRQLERYERLGAVSPHTRSELLASMDQQQRRLAEMAAVAPSPVPAPPVTAATHQPSEEPAEIAATWEPAASVAERAGRYAEQRQAAAAAPIAEPAPQPAVRREPVSRLLAAFMEEKNIRWGELVGGLLIVCSSVALVISFWSEIAERPLLKFIVFNGVTAALFGIGFYTDRRWKIHTTSHGLLLIATLLVPLNFLAIAAFTQAAPPTELLSLGGEGLSILVFLLLIHFASRVIMPDNASLLTAGVMIPSVMQLLVRRFAAPTSSTALLYLLVGIPVVGYVAGCTFTTRRRWQVDSPNETAATRLLMFLGLVSAATLLPLALLTYRVPPMEQTLHRLSPLWVLCGLPGLLTGLYFWRQKTDARLTGLQTIGISVGVLGALVMLASIALAWPEPATLLPVALTVVVVFTAVALWFGLPAAHIPAGLAAAAAWLIGFHLMWGNVTWQLEDFRAMSRALVSAVSGHALVPITGIFQLVAFLFARSGRRDDGLSYGFVSAAIAAVSFALVMWFGFARAGDPEGATWTLAIYAVVALAAATRIDRPFVAWTGAALLLVALIQGVVYRFDEAWSIDRPWAAALLAHATLATAGYAITVRYKRRKHARLRRVWQTSALATSAVAAAWLIALAHITAYATLAYCFLWLTTVWALLAYVGGWQLLMTAGQLAAALAIFAAVAATVETRNWYIASVRPWLDPWFLQAQGIALSIYCLITFGLRQALVRMRLKGSAQSSVQQGTTWQVELLRLLSPRWLTVDQALSTALLALLMLVAVYAAVPGAAQELAPLDAAGSTTPSERVIPAVESYQWAGIPHRHAAGRGGWLLLLAVGAILSVGAWVDGIRFQVPCLVIAGAAACPLLAAHWESDVAVASALRWLVTGFFLLLSLPLWFRQHIAVSQYLGAQADNLDDTTARCRNILVATIIIVYVAMAAYVGGSAIVVAGFADSALDWLPYVLSWSLLAFTLALGIPRVMPGSRSDGEGLSAPWVRPASQALLVLAAGPLAVVFAFAVAAALAEHPITGPEPGSWFRQIGWSGSYGIPLGLTALVLIGHATRERSSGFAFCGGLLLNVVATIVVLLEIGGGALDAAAWITVAQVNAIVSAVYALLWISSIAWYRRTLAAATVADTSGAAWPLLLTTTSLLAAVVCGMFILPAVTNLAMEPLPAGWVVNAGGVWGWTALVLTAMAAIATARHTWAVGQRIPWLLAALVGMIALTTAGWDTSGSWLAYHTLLGGSCLAAWAMPVAAQLARRKSIDAGPLHWVLWSVLFGAATVLLGFRALPSDPASPWWTVTTLLALGTLSVWIAWLEARRAFLWTAAALLQLAVSIWWVERGYALTGTRGLGSGAEFLWTNALAAALLALISVRVECVRIVRCHPGAAGLGPHRFAAWAIVSTLLFTTCLGLLGDAFGNSIDVYWPLAWLTWLAAATAASACWWDPQVRWPIACLYGVGLLAVGLYLDGLDFRGPMFRWALTSTLGSYTLATSFLWNRRDTIGATAARLGLPFSTETATADGLPATARTDGGHGWLVSVNGLLAAIVLSLAVSVLFTENDFGRRMIAAYAVGAQALAVGMLARGIVRSPLQYVSLVIGALFAMGFGWAWLPPDFPQPWLHRSIIALVALTAVIAVYGTFLVKLLRRAGEWIRAAQQLVPLLAAIAGALLLLVLGIEVSEYFSVGEVRIAWPALLAVALAMFGLVPIALAAALVPGRDPFGLSERGRTIYVYAAEALLALNFVHIRVTMPWLFSGWFVQFWPLIVMGIAFVGVGLGELFQRRRQTVLYEPLQNTGALLPLLPALGFWIVSNEVHYSLLLLSMGLLYASLSVLRKSLLFGALAAVAANGSLWYLLHSGEGWGLLEHPQLWLIPPALSVLVGAYLNRRRLSDEQSATIRYAAAIVIYVSSTADIFINGVAQAPWLPAVLAATSLVGVFAGIALRVRAFLYLGTAFLMVALLTIIWYAAIEQQRTWIMWVAGIVTGVLIIALFGLFEKRRDDVLRVVDQLKHWEA